MARQPGRATRIPDSAAPAAAERFAPGVVLDGRYRLSRRLGESAARWAAVDELLDRPVEIRTVDVPPEQLGEFVAKAGEGLDGRWLRLLDAGVASGRSWVALEDPCLPSLVDRVRDAPLEPDAAVAFALAVARALDDVGAAAGRACLTPDRVYVDDEGGVRLDGFAELGDDDASATARSGEPVPDVGRLLLFALTGVWTGLPVSGVEATPEGSPAPRRYRGGIPRRLDAVTVAAVTGSLPTVSALVRELEALPQPGSSTEPRHGWTATRRVAAWVLPPAGLVVVGVVAWLVGSDLGAVPGADVVNSNPRPLPAPRAAHAALVWHHPPAITSFDPAGDGTEDPAGARFAVDGDRSTAWHTDSYRTAAFGGLKGGVGLLIDLGHQRRVGAARIDLTGHGATLQLRAGNSAPQAAAQLPRRAEARTTGSGPWLRLELRHPVTARYWLLYLTRLPRSGDGYAEAIREIQLEPPGGH